MASLHGTFLWLIGGWYSWVVRERMARLFKCFLLMLHEGGIRLVSSVRYRTQTLVFGLPIFT